MLFYYIFGSYTWLPLQKSAEQIHNHFVLPTKREHFLSILWVFNLCCWFKHFSVHEVISIHKVNQFENLYTVVVWAKDEFFKNILHVHLIRPLWVHYAYNVRTWLIFSHIPKLASGHWEMICFIFFWSN